MRGGEGLQVDVLRDGQRRRTTAIPGTSAYARHRTGPCAILCAVGGCDDWVGGMDGVTAAVVIGVGLAVTLLVGIASQRRGRAVPSRPTPPPVPDPIVEGREDMDALSRSIEQARGELLWLREQVARERTRLESLRRQRPAAGAQQAHAAPPAQGDVGGDNPWVVLGLRPGASADDIRRRYRLLSRVWHPDRFTDSTTELRAEAELMMARLNRAHQALSNAPESARR